MATHRFLAAPGPLCPPGYAGAQQLIVEPCPERRQVVETVTAYVLEHRPDVVAMGACPLGHTLVIDYRGEDWRDHSRWK